jgi:hypothetical protein
LIKEHTLRAFKFLKGGIWKNLSQEVLGITNYLLSFDTTRAAQETKMGGDKQTHSKVIS